MSAPVPKAGERKDKGGFGYSCTTRMLTADMRVLFGPALHVPCSLAVSLSGFPCWFVEWGEETHVGGGTERSLMRRELDSSAVVEKPPVEGGAALLTELTQP